MDSELLSVSFMKVFLKMNLKPLFLLFKVCYFFYLKNDNKVIVGTGEGVLDIFNKDEWGNISDRFPGHPSSIDCILPLSKDVALTGCFDGNIRFISNLYFIMRNTLINS